MDTSFATGNSIIAVIAAEGLTINQRLFNEPSSLESYIDVLGAVSHSIEAGGPAPVGFRNNWVHVYDSIGIYLLEDHASRQIEAVEFIFEPSESPFPIQQPFCGELNVCGMVFCMDMKEKDIDHTRFTEDLSGEYSLEYSGFWIGISTKGRRGPNGKRRKPHYVTNVSFCF